MSTAADKKKIEYVLALSTKDFNRSVKLTTGSVDTMSKKMNRSVKKSVASFRDLSVSITKVGVAATAVATGGLALLAMKMSEYVGFANEQEAAETRLAATLRATGGAAGFSANELIAYAGELQQLTTYGDEATIAAMSMLATFRHINGDVFKRGTALAQDLASAMEQDLKTSILSVGKALDNPILGMTALTKAGTTFSAEQKELVRSLQESGDLLGAQTIILDELEKQYGGTAAAMRKNFKGSVDAAGASLGDLKEELGSIITKNAFFVDSAAIVEQMFENWTADINENREEWLEWSKQSTLAVLEFTANTLEALDLLFVGFHQLKAPVQLATASILQLSRGVQFLIEQSAKLAGEDEAVAYWAKAQVDTVKLIERAYDGAIESMEKAEQGNKSVKIAAETVRKFKDQIALIDAKPVDELKDATDDAKGAVGGYTKEITKVGDTWTDVWVETEKEASSSINNIMSQLEDMQNRDWTTEVPIVSVEKHAAGGTVGYQSGGKLPGYGGGDKIHALLEAGEFVVRKEAVSHFGAGKMEAINSMQLPKFQTGGPVGAGGDTVNINLTLPGAGEPVLVRTDRYSADKLIKDVARMKRLSSS